MNDQIVKSANFFVGMSLLAVLLSFILFFYTLAYQQYNDTHNKMMHANTANIHNTFARINNLEDPVPVATIYSLCTTYTEYIAEIKSDATMNISNISDLNKYLDCRVYVKVNRQEDDTYKLLVTKGGRCT